MKWNKDHSFFCELWILFQITTNRACVFDVAQWFKKKLLLNSLKVSLILTSWNNVHNIRNENRNFSLFFSHGTSYLHGKGVNLFHLNIQTPQQIVRLLDQISIVYIREFCKFCKMCQVYYEYLYVPNTLEKS